MKRLLSTLLLSIGFGAVLHVPDDWSTIQAGIDAAQEGATVLVAPGEYMENLIIEKTITLASRAHVRLQTFLYGGNSFDTTKVI